MTTPITENENSNVTVATVTAKPAKTFAKKFVLFLKLLISLVVITTAIYSSTRSYQYLFEVRAGWVFSLYKEEKEQEKPQEKFVLSTIEREEILKQGKTKAICSIVGLYLIPALIFVVWLNFVLGSWAKPTFWNGIALLALLFLFGVIFASLGKPITSNSLSESKRAFLGNLGLYLIAYFFLLISSIPSYLWHWISLIKKRKVLGQTNKSLNAEN